MSNTDLFISIENGKIDEVRRLINDGINVNEKNKDGQTPLHLAVEKNNKEAVDALLKARGINVYAKDSSGKTPLDLAHYRDHKGSHTTLMIALTQTQKEIEGLYSAIKQVNVKEIDDLINGGVNVNVRDQNGMTPLHYAAKKHNEDIANALIKAGADINIKDQDGRTPLHWAAIERNEGVANALIKAGADVNAKDDYGRIPLHWAVNAGSIEVTQILLETKVNVNAQDKNGKAPLHLAAKENHAELVKVLLSNRADISVKDHHGDTPFNLTTNEEIKALLRNAALLEAVKSGNISEVKDLLEKGANVNTQNDRKDTPLHLAVQNGHTEIVSALIKVEGIDINAKDRDGNTPLDLARTEEIKTLLKEAVERTDDGGESSTGNEGDPQKDAGAQQPDDNKKGVREKEQVWSLLPKSPHKQKNSRALQVMQKVYRKMLVRNRRKGKEIMFNYTQIVMKEIQRRKNSRAPFLVIYLV